MTEPPPGRPMPPALRAVFGTVMLLVALFLAAFAADLVTREALLALGRTEVVATVTAKEVLHGKGGTTRQVTYTFEVDGTPYHRTAWFGLFAAPSEIGASLFSTLEVGSPLPVVYSSLSPRTSRPAGETFDPRLVLGLLAGAALSGFLGFRELRALLFPRP